MRLEPGSQPVPNRPEYVLVRKRGAGAFGEVWHVKGPGDLDLALKFIRLDSPFGSVELESIRVMRGIRHPNLVGLFGAWYAEGYLIIAMELCDRTLDERLKEAQSQNLSGIPVEELLGYMNDAASGLDSLNASKRQHRDVKPANLLLLGSGVKVADFGLAKALEHTVATNSGAGTIAYLPPECFKGQIARQSDQYSLAVTYYHLRTGRLLFAGDQAQIMYGHLHLKPDLSVLPRAEQAVIARALAKDPAKRWSNCREFVSNLVRVQADPEQPAKWWSNWKGLLERLTIAGEPAKVKSKKADEPAQVKRKPPDKPVAVAKITKRCGYCKKSLANGAPVKIELSLKLEEGVYAKKEIEVPCCVSCAHKNLLVTSLGLGAIIASGILGLGLITGFKDEFPSLTTVAVACFPFFWPLLGFFFLGWWQKRRDQKLATYPPIRSLLEGDDWRFGGPVNRRMPPPGINLQLDAKRKKASTAFLRGVIFYTLLAVSLWVLLFMGIILWETLRVRLR